MNKSIKKVLKKALSEKQYVKLQGANRSRIKAKKTKQAERRFKADCERKKEEFHRKFRSIMFEANIADNFDRTITPVNIERITGSEADGITCELKIPDGLSVDAIDKVKSALAQNVYGKCMVYIDNQPLEPIKFSAIKSWHNVLYKPVENLTASQLFLGYTIDLKPIIVDMAKYPHLLITGGSGGGKSKLVEVIMTNLAYNNTEEELELYYLQLSKDDNFKYELLTHCKGCITATSYPTKLDTYRMALKMLQKIDNELTSRGLLVKEKLGRKSEDINIHIYNQKFKQKLPVLQLWIDEAATLYKKDPNKQINDLIEEMKQITERIASAGRYVGIYLINVMQRASKDELPREIKINTMNWISFNQKDAGASKVAIGDETSAVGLPQRVFAIMPGGGNVIFGKTPFSKWDENVNSLDKKGVIREASKEQLDNIYSIWNTTASSKENDKKEKQKSKIVSTELSKVQEDLNKVLNQMQILKFELDNKDEVIKSLMNKTYEEKEKPLPNDALLSRMNELLYTTADNQKEEVNNITDCSNYMEIPKLPSKRKTKKGQN